MNLLIIKKISEQKGISIRSIADGISMSEQNLYRCIRENKIQAGDLECIANILGVSIFVFFENSNNSTSDIAIGHSVKGNGNKVSGNIALNECQKELEHLKELLAEKERTIQILMNQSK